MNQKFICNMYYMDNLLDYFKAYDTFCFQNCLRLLLKFEGIKLPELYINASINVECCISDNKIDIYTKKDTRGLLPSVSNVFKRTYCDNDSDVFFDNLLYIEKEQKPIIIGVDTYYLPYASNYKKNHAIHTALLMGYNMYKRVVYIMDWYFPWFFKGEISFEECIAARNSNNPSDGSIFSGTSIRNNYAVLNEIVPAEERKLVLEMLECSKDNHKNREKKNQAVGSEAYRLLKEYFNNNFEDVNKSKLSQQILLITKRYIFFKQYVVLARNYLSNGYQDIEDECNKIIKELDIVHFLLLKMDYGQNPKYIIKFNNHIDNVITLHDTIQKEINELYQKME